MEFFHVTQELSNLVWLGLATVVLQIERTSHLRMLVNVVAASNAVPAIPERHSHFAGVFETDVPGTGEHLLIKLPRFHVAHWEYSSRWITSTRGRTRPRSCAAVDGNKNGEKVEIFAFNRGYSAGAKTGRAMFHGVADVLT